MERFPESYDAGLAIGGTAEPMSRFVAERAFRLRLLFDHFLPGLPGSVVAPPDGGGDPLRVYREAAALLRESPEHAEALRSMVGIPTDALVARAVNTYSLVLADLVDTLGGNAVDNRNTVYTGSADDVALNRALPRYAADGPAVAALARLPKPPARSPSRCSPSIRCATPSCPSTRPSGTAGSWGRRKPPSCSFSSSPIASPTTCRRRS